MNAMTQARRFFNAHGRDIDRARFAYHAGEATQDALLDVLARYQTTTAASDTRWNPISPPRIATRSPPSWPW